MVEPWAGGLVTVVTLSGRTQPGTAGVAASDGAPGYSRAAELALEGNDFQACLEHAERAISLGAAAESRGHLRQLQAEAARWSGQLGDASRYGSEALALLREDTAHAS